MKINEGGGAGTDLESIFNPLNREYLSIPTPDKKTLLWFSDGGDNTLDYLSGDPRKVFIKQLVATITPNKTSSLRVLAIGLGSEKGSQIPEVLDNGQPVMSKLQADILKSFSVIGNGHYYAANDLSTMEMANTLGKTINNDSAPTAFNEYIPSENDNEEANEPIYDLYYQIPLGIAIMLFVFILFLPDTWIKNT